MGITITLTGKTADLFNQIQHRLDTTPEIANAMTDEQVIALCLMMFKTANETPLTTPLSMAFNLAVLRFQVEIMGEE